MKNKNYLSLVSGQILVRDALLLLIRVVDQLVPTELVVVALRVLLHGLMTPHTGKKMVRKILILAGKNFKMAGKF